jgi:hypothetical protein
MYSHCIIGAGTTGLILLLLLIERGIDPATIVIIDPYFDGGDLRRKWGQVISNTPWSKTYESVKTALPSLKMPLWATAIPSDQLTPLSQISSLIHELALPILSKIKLFQGTVKKANHDKVWNVVLQHESATVTVDAENIYFNVGSEQKTLDLSTPSIPLDIALDVSRLRHYVKPTDKVILFGTAHSGSLILKNLVDLSVQTTAVYRTTKPFLFARDGEYDGIKGDAAVFADDVIQGKYPSLNIIPASLTSSVIRETRSANWAIYATGFEPRNNIEITLNGEKKSVTKYSPTTGKITDCPNAWGFGIAYPSQAPDGIHFDVGVASFIEHIKLALC